MASQTDQDNFWANVRNICKNTEVKHTPAPWQAMCTVPVVRDDEGNEVAEVDNPSDRLLVAEAPEMLDLLKRAFTFLDPKNDQPLDQRPGFYGLLRDIGKAITKVQG